jgi:zinc D-Ala-D-Ala carboxypeptidase
MASSLKFLTDNFTWAEAVVTHNRAGIVNTIQGESTMGNILNTAMHMEKVRECLGGVPILISSWYRSPALNTQVGGARNSDHLLGAAVDFIAPAYGTPLEICKKLVQDKNLLGFKQLILEHSWVHISWNTIPNVAPKLEVLSLLSSGAYARGLTDNRGNPLA